MCPSDHSHGMNSTCYATHGCRCRWCEDTRRQSRPVARIRREYQAEIRDLLGCGFEPHVVARMFEVSTTSVREVAA